MPESDLKTLRRRTDRENFAKLAAVPNPKLHAFVADAVALCQPKEVFVCSDRKADIERVRKRAVSSGEEHPLATPGHTIHFDGYFDQGRDREATKYLVPPKDSLSKALNQVERRKGLAEVRRLLRGSMRGRTMIVRFLSLGPAGSVFSIPCVQCTDSYYVGHSEDLLYRAAYRAFKALGPGADFFAILHSLGVVDERMVSTDVAHKRIYIDYTRDKIYSVNTQYAGNTVGLKKLALRLTIRKADREGWLAEHMFLMGVKGPGGRKTYFAGAFPSACGKTATAMLPGETILGDDIAYFRAVNGQPRAVNAEAGIFGIIQNVNATDDPVIYDVLTKPGEVIFSNVLVKNGRPYWLGMGLVVPEDGENVSGEWRRGKAGPDGAEVPPAHKNARYTVALRALANVDPELENPEGVVLGGVIYGGRDADTCVPVRQSFDWAHGIVTCGASLETETTFAILGAEGKREINVMSIQDFLAIPIGKYIANNLNFGARLDSPPPVFGVNYFLRDKAGKFLTGMHDKHVWVKWMERRVHGEVGSIETPTGWIPRYDDLVLLFREVLGAGYARATYEQQFTLRVPENLARLDRVEKFFREEAAGAPPAVAEVLAAQRGRLLAAQKKHGDYISPFAFDLP